MLFVYASDAAARDGTAVVRLSKRLLGARTAISERGLDSVLGALERRVPGFAVVEREPGRPCAFKLPRLVEDELVGRRPPQLLAWDQDLSRDVTCLERAVWGVLLARYGGTPRGAWPSADLLAEIVGTSRSQTFVALERLKRRGLQRVRRLRRGDLLPTGDRVGKGCALRFVESDKASNMVKTYLMRSSLGPSLAKTAVKPTPADPGLPPPQIPDPRVGTSRTATPADPGHESLCQQTKPDGGLDRGRAADIDAVLEHFRARHHAAVPPDRFRRDRARRKIVAQHLESFSVAELQRAAENPELSKGWDRHWSRNCRVEMVYRSADTVEELLALRPLRAPRVDVPPPALVEEQRELTLEQRLTCARDLRNRFGIRSRLLEEHGEP